MVDTTRQEASNWPAVVAAMIYLAGFFATCYGLYSLATDRSFFEAFAVAFFSVFGVAVLFYLAGIAREVSLRHRTATRERAPVSTGLERSIELTSVRRTVPARDCP